jgi:membrane protein implicated in regulation of membrane protease activity
MDAWVWWLIVALLLGVAEVSTTTLVFAMMTGGAFAAGAASIVGADVTVQLVVFAAVSALLILVARPVARRHLHTPALTRSGVAALVGSEAIVVEPVDPRDGRIMLAGEVWSARTYDGESEWSAGTAVYVSAIDGATALVAER